MIETQNLTYKYNKGPHLTFPDISCNKEEHWLILGESGSGKTTFLHLISGLLKPLSGKILIDGEDLASLSGKQLDYFRGDHIGIVFQRSHFVRSLTVTENLLLANYLSGLPQDKDKVNTYLARLNLKEKANVRINNLSQGEQQRVAIARALINDPKVIFADEPTSALDDKNCFEVLQLIEDQAREQGATLLIVTHDQRLKDRFANQIDLGAGTKIKEAESTK